MSSPRDAGRQRNDYLGLSQSATVRKLLEKHAGKTGVMETICWSDFIVKINPRDKPQERVMMVTDQAIYNLLPTDYAKCKRRIPLDAIDYLTVSQASDEFVLHVPSEYDYRLLSLRKDEVVSTVQQVFMGLTGEALIVDLSPQIVLKSVCVTRTQAKRGGPKRQGRRSSTMSTASSGGGGSGSMSHGHGSGSGSVTASGGGSIGIGIGIGKGGMGADDVPPPAKKRQVSGWGKETSEVGPDDFQLLKVVGRGSFGKVLLCRKKGDPDKTRTLAMKILKKEALVKRNQVEHTRAERGILEEINHPFLMSLSYAFQTESKLYLVMPYLTGGELFFHLKQERRFSESRSRFYTAEIALGLGHLHSLNIVYRDLKPENLLLDAQGHIKLTDFGLSKRYEEGTQAQTFCGTPEYLAPEVISGVGHGKEVDWWSLGILLFEMLVGLPPFYSENVNLMYQFIAEAELRIPSFVSPNARNIITDLLARDPMDRMGFGPEDVEQVKAAEFFRGLDFRALVDREVQPEFVPKVKSAASTENVDAEFTNEPVVDTYVPPSAIGGGADFDGFTYQESGALSSAIGNA